MRKALHTSITAALLIACCFCSYAQELNISLSQKHLVKIEKIKDPAKKLKKYRKFYSKDSLKLFRQADLFMDRWTDSVAQATQKIKERPQKLVDKLKTKQQHITSSAADKLEENALRATVMEREYKLPPELERKYSAHQLKRLYGVMRTHIASLRSDSLNLEKFGAHKTKLTSKFNVPDVSTKIPDVASVPDPLAQAKKRAGSLKDEAKNHKSLRALSKQQKQLHKYTAQAAAYKKIYGTLPKERDGVIDFGESKLMSLASQRKELQQLEAIKKQQAALQNPWENQYKSQADQLTDSTYLKEQARRKAEELAMQYIQDNPAVVQGVQKKMALLMKKYSVVPNSNDLSTAVKRSSLEGKPLKQRLHLAANFQVISLEPVSIDFAPAIGYKFNRYFIVGIGGTYRETFSKDKTPLSPDVLGYKGFVSYDVVRSFFAYGEYANNSPGMQQTERGAERIWKQALLLGIGRKFMVHKNLEMTCLVAYNFFHEPNDPVYPRPLVVRVGLQLSELALMK